LLADRGHPRAEEKDTLSLMKLLKSLLWFLVVGILLKAIEKVVGDALEQVLSANIWLSCTALLIWVF
jgi:hypothetical protein